MTETVHGVLLTIEGLGVLITGEAAAGKSECALDLISRGHRLVADDVVLVKRTSETLTGKAPDRFSGLIEIRDIGIVDFRQAFGEDSFAAESKIDLCIELKKNGTGEIRGRIDCGPSEIEMLAIKLPHFILSVEPGRNLAALVELAVRLVSLGAHGTERDLVAIHDAAVANRSPVAG